MEKSDVIGKIEVARHELLRMKNLTLDSYYSNQRTIPRIVSKLAKDVIDIITPIAKEQE